MGDEQAEQAEELEFDELVARLQSVVTRLEQGNLSLEESLRAYEEGVNLARRGHSLLSQAEERVELLMRQGQATRRLSLETDDSGNGED